MESKHDHDKDTFNLANCPAALVYYDPDNKLQDNSHYKQLLAQFFGRVVPQDQIGQLQDVETVFICGAWRQVIQALDKANSKVTVRLVKEFVYNAEKADNGDKDKSQEVSYRQLALRIPGLENTNDRLVPLDEGEDWYNILTKSQEWYELMHANHQDAPALRKGTYCSAAGPLPRSIWLQRCSTVFREPTQVFGDVHDRLHALEAQADRVFFLSKNGGESDINNTSKDPNIMLIQHYEPNAIIGAHSDKTVDLENLVFRSFSAYQGFSKGQFDDKKIQVDPNDYRVWGLHQAGRSTSNIAYKKLKSQFRPVIRFLTLTNKTTGATIRVPLPPNWMYVMTDKTHREWTHEIRKQPSARPRISVTSRFSATLAQYSEFSDDKTASVQLYRPRPSGFLCDIGQLHMATQDECQAIDDAYKAQNTLRDTLPDYSKLLLCTRNPGDLATPKAFLLSS